MTLIELLVVIIIITTIVAAAIPLMSPTNDDRRLREAARAVNTFIGGAQSRAIALVGRLAWRSNGCHRRYEEAGRPTACGIEAVLCRAAAAVCRIRCQLAGLRGASSRFAGHCARAIRHARAEHGDGLPVGWDADLFPPATIHPGDVIEINGTQYELLPSITTICAVRQQHADWFDRHLANSKQREPGGDSGGPAEERQRPADQSEIRRSGARSKLAVGAANRPYWTGPVDVQSPSPGRRPRPTSRTRCPKGRRSICGPPAWERQFLLRGER